MGRNLGKGDIAADQEADGRLKKKEKKSRLARDTVFQDIWLQRGQKGRAVPGSVFVEGRDFY